MSWGRNAAQQAAETVAPTLRELAAACILEADTGGSAGAVSVWARSLAVSR